MMSMTSSSPSTAYCASINANVRLLILTNFFPPYQIGGYERLCQQVVDRLRARGHATTILTSMYGVPRPELDDNVHRVLGLQGDLYFYRASRLIEAARHGRRDRAYLRREL